MIEYKFECVYKGKKYKQGMRSAGKNMRDLKLILQNVKNTLLYQIKNKFYENE